MSKGTFKHISYANKYDRAKMLEEKLYLLGDSYNINYLLKDSPKPSGKNKINDLVQKVIFEERGY